MFAQRLPGTLLILLAFSGSGCLGTTSEQAIALPEPSTVAAESDSADTPDADTPDAGSAVAENETSGDRTATAAGGDLKSKVTSKELGTITVSVPAQWVEKRPSVSFILAEYTLPKVEGDSDDGRLTVSRAGGSIKDNIQRWRGQFRGKLLKDETKEIKVDGLTVTLIDFAGEYNDRRGPFAPGVTKPGYRMLAAIIPVDGQLHFVKCTGPVATLTSHEKAFEQFVRSVRTR
jgi:hypothetical protein